MADTHDTRLRWERRRAGAYRAQVAHENGVLIYALEREGRFWLLKAHGPVGTRVIATDLRTMREGRDLAQRVTDLRARREAQRAQAQAMARRREAQWRSKAQAWMGYTCSSCEDTSRLWECAPCTCGSDTQAQAQAQAQAQRTEWRNGARLTWRPFYDLARMLAQARVAQ